MSSAAIPMTSESLLKTAEKLLSTKPGAPRQSDLRRAASTAYYALFHHLARTCAQALVGSESAREDAWRQVYRALGHNGLRDKNAIQQMGKRMQDFAEIWTTMQQKRNDADYDPWEHLFKSDVADDIASVRQAIADFESASPKEKRALAVLALGLAKTRSR